MRRMFTAIIVAAVLTGCSTSRPRARVTVANAGGGRIQDVVLSSGETVYCSADVIEPGETCRPVRLASGERMDATVRWRTDDGRAMTKTVQLEPSGEKCFRGKVYLQIDDGSEVKVFFVRDLKKGASDLPWTERQSWEGAPTIPGLSQ